MINHLILAFAMYTKIPMPKVIWNEKKMSYVMCAFPVVGIVLAGIVYGAERFFQYVGLGHGLRTALLVVLPLWYTGGIHMDGYMDTCDALGSWGDRAKKLEILKDSHVGAMAVIKAITICVLQFGIWWELQGIPLQMACLGFVLSRILSAFGILLLPCAKDSGLAATFQAGARRGSSLLILAIEGGLLAAIGLWMCPGLALLQIATGLVCFGYYGHLAGTKFGGTTGDLAGWFLQLCETLMSLAALLGGWIWY